MQRIAAALPLSLFATVALAQKPAPASPTPEPAAGAELLDLRAWIADYRRGAVRLVKEDRTDDAAVAGINAMLQRVAATNTLDAAKLLFEVAAIDPTPPGSSSSTELIDYQRELQPWRVQGLAQRHLRSMTGDGVLPWLLQQLQAPGLRGAAKNADQKNAAAVLRVLAGHPSIEAQLELLRACRAMPAELRVVAVNAMGKESTLDLVPTLIELLRDVEPNVRIAAASAIGTALAPHVDETAGKQPAGPTLATRDQAIAKLVELLERDTVWQVRSAAAYALAIMRCKPAIPALIRGLEVELARKKDPWAMDVRLHRLLEGLTGQAPVRGSIAPWKDFWAREGATFTVRPATAAGQPKPTSDQYEKFFDLEVESDRVLFVVDFSGSMAEPITLKARTTSSAPGQTTTKAALVVGELKKMIMSLPDGAMVNLIVFSDDVRTWRQEGGRPTLVKIDDAARDDLLGSFLDGLRPAGPTNLYGGLDRALDFAGRALHDKYYAAGFDTIYVISDGAPTVGAITDKEQILAQVRETNRLRRLTIHCVTFGDQNDTSFLGTLATENGGRHIHVE